MTENTQTSSSKKRLVEVFTGSGKGKTSAAMGVVLRALGHDLRVCVIHFMKGEYPYGERKALACLPNVTIKAFGSLSFVDPHKVKDEDKKEARKALEAGREAMLSGDYDLVVLDEINVAAAWKLVDIEEVMGLIKNKPDSVELILTGRYADPRIVKIADLVTEMVAIKHPYDEGVQARAGFEY